MSEVYSFGDLFWKYRVKAGFKTLSQIGDSFATQGLILENSIFSHWQRGSRIPTHRNIIITLIKILISRNAISSVTDANLILESAGHGYITKSEAVELFPQFTDKFNGASFNGPITDTPNFSVTPNTKVSKKIAQIYVDLDIARFNFTHPFTFSTGLKSPIFVDNRLLLSYPQERSWVIEEMVKLIKREIPLENIDYISSSLSFAAPFGVLISNALNLPLILVRDKKTSFGRFTKIEGNLPYGKRVLIVEDIISTGVGPIDNCETVRKAGGRAQYCIAILDYKIDIVKKSMRNEGLKTFSLVDGNSIVNEAKRKNIITEQEKHEVNEWLKAPFKWGQINGFYKNSDRLEDYC